MAQFTAEDLKGKTPEELALLGSRNHPLSQEGILLEKEWQSRLIKESTRLSSRQTGFWIIVGAMVGAILSSILPAILSHLLK